MRYTNLPAVGSLPLPDLTTRWTAAHSAGRGGRKIEDVWLHRWGIADWRSESIDGVIREFLDPSKDASAHFVYAGEIGPNAGRCVQMVRYADSAWTEAAFNKEGVSIECADAIWLGHDPKGFARVARITAFLLHRFNLGGKWVRDPHTHALGVTRHADGGSDGGGHTQCPTTDLELWGQFIRRVDAELALGGFRKEWGR